MLCLSKTRVKPCGSNLRACTRTLQGHRSEFIWVKTGPISDDMEVEEALPRERKEARREGDSNVGVDIIHVYVKISQ